MAGLDLTPTDAPVPRVRDHRGLLLLCVGGAVVEAALVGWLGPRSALPLVPQATAPAPFGVFHDVRWLLVYTPSWLIVALSTTAFVLVRGGLTALSVRLAWPEGVPRPGFRVLYARAITFTLAAAVLLTVSGSLLVASAVASISYLFFAAVPVALFIALLIHHGPVVPWWREGPTWRTVGWVASTFLVLTVGGAALALAPWPADLAIAAAAGLFNAWAWHGIVRALACRRAHRFVPLAPVGLATVVAVAFVGVVVALELQTAKRSLDGAASAFSRTEAQPVLVITGYWSTWNGRQPPLDLGPGFVQRRFSYTGLEDDGSPRHYRGADTDQPLPTLVRLLDEQVRRYADHADRRIDIVSDSGGALIAKAYLLVHPDAPVRSLVLTSPLVAPGRAYFPERHASGYGLVAGWELRGVASALRALTSLPFSPDGSFIRSVANNAPPLQRAIECPLPATEQLAMVPLADAVAAPYGATSEIPAVVLPAFHGKLLHQRTAQRTIGNYLRTGEVPGYAVLRVTERVLRAAAAAWQAPSLRTDLNAVWRPLPAEDCATTTERLREWLR